MLLTTAQMKAYHKLNEIKDLEIKCLEKQVELVNEWKLLGVKQINKQTGNLILTKLPNRQRYHC